MRKTRPLEVRLPKISLALPPMMRLRMAAEAEGWQLRHLAVAEQTLCLLWQVAGAADGADVVKCAQ